MLVALDIQGIKLFPCRKVNAPAVKPDLCLTGARLEGLVVSLHSRGGYLDAIGLASGVVHLAATDVYRVAEAAVVTQLYILICLTLFLTGLNG